MWWAQWQLMNGDDNGNVSRDIDGVEPWETSNTETP